MLDGSEDAARRSQVVESRFIRPCDGIHLYPNFPHRLQWPPRCNLVKPSRVLLLISSS